MQIEQRYVLVPVEPTEAMIDAGDDYLTAAGCNPLPEDALKVYRAMIAARPDSDMVAALWEALKAEDAYWAASRQLAAALPRLREGARAVFEAADARRTAARAAIAAMGSDMGKEGESQ